MSNGICLLFYNVEGDFFSIIFEEGSVKMICNFIIYVFEILEDIFFDIEDLGFKIIIQVKWLLDVLVEFMFVLLEKLIIIVSKVVFYFKFISVGGVLGSGGIDFVQGKDLFEIFFVRKKKWSQVFKFDMFKVVNEVMRIVIKVSLRGDGQGVLSMQFLVEVGGEGGGVCFLDFRFVFYVDREEEDDDEMECDEGEYGMEVDGQFGGDVVWMVLGCGG